MLYKKLEVSGGAALMELNEICNCQIEKYWST